MFRKNNKIHREFRNAEIEDSILTITEKEVDKLEAVFDRKWLNFFWYAVVFSLLVLLMRAGYLSLYRGDFYREMAKENKTRNFVIKAPRGKIYDREGKLLASNAPGIDLVIFPADLPIESEERKKISFEIAKIININQGEIWQKIESAAASVSFQEPFLLQENISQDQALFFLEKAKNFPGIKIEKRSLRNYADGLIFSHIIGYEGKIKREEKEENPDYLMTDSIGKYGLEKYYEKNLRGEKGTFRVEVDSLGIIKKEIGVINPVPGDNLYLNINADLQKKIFDSLAETMDKESLPGAAAVAIDPRDGGVLALVSLPSFDNNLFAKGISVEEYKNLISDEKKPLFNRVVSGEYAPGSVIKPLIACAALSEGVISENTQIESRGGIQVGNWFFGDWKAHGFTDVRKAIAVSSDVFFYSVGGGYGNIRGMGMSVMKKYEEQFGLGKISGLDTTGEASGFIPDEKWKEETLKEKWYVGNSYHAAIGQGYLTATPLQLANYIAAIANGGILYQPRLVYQIKKNNGEKILLPPKILNSNFIDKKIIEIVREGMRMTVTEGTAQILKNLPVAVAGKTGTAQYGNKEETFGWFVSFAPYENPEIVLVVLLEGQKENTYNAVPVTEKIYRWYFSR